MRGMPSVATVSTCVSPRWNNPVPCAVGMIPTSADSGRMSASPRPSMRTPSLTIRSRTTLFCSERNAFDSSRSRPAKGSGLSVLPASVAIIADSISSSRVLRAVLSAIAIASVVASSTSAVTASDASGW